MFAGLTRSICQQAWDLVLPTIDFAASEGVINKFAGSIVVLDPRDGETLFTDQIDPDNDKAGVYSEIALAKARVSWETGLTSREVQQNAPHLYQPGMTKWGGAVVENKLVVAFSGVQAVFDEAISWMVLNWILALCQDEMTRPGGVMESESDFISHPGSLQPPNYGAIKD